jgi:hypothetical protein
MMPLSPVGTPRRNSDLDTSSSGSSSADDAMSIYIQMVDGRFLNLTVSPSDQVSVVKGQIAAYIQVAAKNQHLWYGGVQMGNGSTMQECNVLGGSTLGLQVRIRGGGGKGVGKGGKAKTLLCAFWMKGEGNCIKGMLCSFAHGTDELDFRPPANYGGDDAPDGKGGKDAPDEELYRV